MLYRIIIGEYCFLIGQRIPKETVAAAAVAIVTAPTRIYLPTLHRGRAWVPSPTAAAAAAVTYGLQRCMAIFVFFQQIVVCARHT